MMATVLRKVKLVNKNKSETGNGNGAWETEEKDVRGRMNPGGDTFVQCGRVCGLVNVCTGPADSMGSRRRRNRPRRRGNPHLTLFQSLQLRIDLWTNTTGHLFDRSFTRRFCHRKSENELYRSNSFRFEKFDKQEEDLAQQWQQTVRHVKKNLFCKQTQKISNMMPIKKILEERHSTPTPPVLVLDETTVKCTVDAGPVCGCDENYQVIQSYRPFTFGGVDPYRRRKIPDSDCLKVFWMKVKIGTNNFIYEKPVAIHEAEIPENFKFPRLPFVEDNHMLVRRHKYTDGYVAEKLTDCIRDHKGDCYCCTS